MTRKTKAGSKRKPGKKFTIEMTSLSVGFWVFSLFFLLAWVFVLGILVGRGFLPGGVTAFSDLKVQFDKKVQDLVGRNQSRDNKSQKDSEPDPKLLFYERLSSKKDEAKQDFSPPRDAGRDKGHRMMSPQNEAPEVRRTEDPVAVPGKKSLQNVAGSASENVEKTRAGTGVPDNPEGTSFTEMRFTVQLASMTEKDKAEEMIDGLVKRGYPAYYYEVKVNGKTFYRVRCGRFATREQAEKYSEKLTRLVGFKGFVYGLE